MLTYVCSETKSEKSTDHDFFFAKYRIFIGKVPQVHKGTVHQFIIFETYLCILSSAPLPVSFPFGVGNPERKPLFTLPSLSPLFQALPVVRSIVMQQLSNVGRMVFSSSNPHNRRDSP